MNELDCIINKLFSMQEEKYRVFQCKLMPTVNPDAVIGIRTPILRAYAKELSKTPQARVFLSSLPHTYYEEYNLHAFLIETLHEYGTIISELNRFLPYVDNWATCDSMSPKIKPSYLPEFYTDIKRWIATDDEYSVRFGIEMLMKYYLGNQFREEYAILVSSVTSDKYYVNMMIAWYFATALAKNYDSVIYILEEKYLDKWTHNKTIRKAIESYRISDDKKAYLRTLTIK